MVIRIPQFMWKVKWEEIYPNHPITDEPPKEKCIMYSLNRIQCMVIWSKRQSKEVFEVNWFDRNCSNLVKVIYGRNTECLFCACGPTNVRISRRSYRLWEAKWKFDFVDFRHLDAVIKNPGESRLISTRFRGTRSS